MKRTTLKNDSIGRTGKHNELCEGHVNCPVTGKEECGRELISGVSANGQCSCVMVFCFGCGKPHNVNEE